MNDIYVPHRLEGETQDDYRTRQRAKQAALKVQKSGTMFWNSYENGQYKKGLK
jgi:hypothetical protein